MRKLLLLLFVFVSFIVYAQPDTVAVVGQDPNNRGGDSKKEMQIKANAWHNYLNSGIDSLKTGVDDVKTWVGYGNSIDIPSYDATNSEHWLIDSDSDMDSIDSDTKRFFYVAPGEYTYQIIRSSGTSEEKRYLSLYNTNDTHPAKLLKSEQADVDLYFASTSYWIVDRMSNFDSQRTYCYEVHDSCTNMLFNRLHFSNYTWAISIHGTPTDNPTDSITIQNSRFGPMSWEGIDADAVAVMLTGPATGRLVKNTHILNNEFFNNNDAIALPASTEDDVPGVDEDYQGTLIDGNLIYVTNEVYTDGSGNFCRYDSAKWALTENAIDIKSGSSDSTNKVIVSNNYMGGFRTTDINGGGSGSNGSCITAHYGVKYLDVLNNTFFNSNRGISTGSASGSEYGVDSVIIQNNIFHNIGYDAGGDHTITVSDDNRVLIDGNIIRDTSDQMSTWMWNSSVTLNTTVTNNVVINKDVYDSDRTGITCSDNWFYNTTRNVTGDGTVYSTEAEANMKDTSFDMDKYTNLPWVEILNNVVTTTSSPHY